MKNKPKKVSLLQGNWQDVSKKGHKMQSIKRLSDQKIFSIGDFVTNGTRMRGKIEKFNTDDNVKNRDKNSPIEIYVTTDWSGIGMNLDSIYHVENKPKPMDEDRRLPSAFKPGDFCGMKLGKTDIIGAQVTKVAFTQSKVLYDIEIGVGNDMVTRIHSLDSAFVVPLNVSLAD